MAYKFAESGKQYVTARAPTSRTKYSPQKRTVNYRFYVGGAGGGPEQNIRTQIRLEYVILSQIWRRFIGHLGLHSAESCFN